MVLIRANHSWAAPRPVNASVRTRGRFLPAAPWITRPAVLPSAPPAIPELCHGERLQEPGWQLPYQLRAPLPAARPDAGLGTLAGGSWAHGTRAVAGASRLLQDAWCQLAGMSPGEVTWGLRPLQTLKAPSSSPSSPCITVHRGQGQGGAVPTQPEQAAPHKHPGGAGRGAGGGVPSGRLGGAYPSPTQPLGSSLAPPGPPTCRSPYRQENLVREGTAASCWGPEPL